MFIQRLKSFLGNVAPNLAPQKPDTLNLDFKSNESITIGIEVELQIIDKRSLSLCDRADELIERLKPHSDQYVPELFKSIIEINSSPHPTVHELGPEMERLLNTAQIEANAMGCALMGSGCHPIARYEELVTRTSERYEQLLDRNQWLMRRWMVSGMHIHLAMPSANECIRFMMFFEHYIPHLLALSASSPYWQSSDTGLESCRSIISEALPTASLIYTIDSWAGLVELVNSLKISKTITHLKDLHWDIRPSPGYGTLELRVFDMPTNLKDILAIAAFVHTLALWFSQQGDWLTSMPKPTMWMARENKWRAMRYGLDAEIIQNFEGQTICIKEDLQKLLTRIDEVVRAKNYSAHIDHLKTMIESGNSSLRQRCVFENTGSLEEVVRHNINEYQQGAPLYPSTSQAKNVISSA
jgi:glutamate---cysteine ligase / carboxylate-amine ligase